MSVLYEQLLVRQYLFLTLLMASSWPENCSHFWFIVEKMKSDTLVSWLRDPIIWTMVSSFLRSDKIRGTCRLLSPGPLMPPSFLLCHLSVVSNDHLQSSSSGLSLVMGVLLQFTANNYDFIWFSCSVQHINLIRETLTNPQKCIIYSLNSVSMPKMALYFVPGY